MLSLDLFLYLFDYICHGFILVIYMLNIFWNIINDLYYYLYIDLKIVCKTQMFILKALENTCFKICT